MQKRHVALFETFTQVKFGCGKGLVRQSRRPDLIPTALNPGLSVDFLISQR